MTRFFLTFAALSGLLAVGLGAFAAHGLKPRLDPALLSAFQTGVTYQMYHALALVGIAVLTSREPNPWLKAAGYCFMIGTLTFSGSLYGLAIGGPRWLGPITPLGGLAFLSGWLCLLVASRKLALK